MRRLDSMIPQADDDDVFGQHAVYGMQRILAVGWQGWIDEEIANPSWEDSDWCRMVVALSQDRFARLSEEPNLTFRCSTCKDTGFLPGRPIRRFRMDYQAAVECSPCAYRDWLRLNFKPAHRRLQNLI